MGQLAGVCPQQAPQIRSISQTESVLRCEASPCHPELIKTRWANSMVPGMGIAIGLGFRISYFGLRVSGSAGNIARATGISEVETFSLCYWLHTNSRPSSEGQR